MRNSQSHKVPSGHKAKKREKADDEGGSGKLIKKSKETIKLGDGLKLMTLKLCTRAERKKNSVINYEVFFSLPL